MAASLHRHGPGATPRPGRLTSRPSPGYPGMAGTVRGGRLLWAIRTGRHDDHRAGGVMRHLVADRAHPQPREAAGAARGDDQQVSVFGRLDELVGGHTADGPQAHILVAVAGNCLVNYFLGRLIDLVHGLLGRAELPGDTPTASGTRCK